MATGTGGRDELSSALRDLRLAAGAGRKLTLREAAEAAGEGFSTAKLSRIERGAILPSPEDTDTLARLYNAPSDTRRRLVQLARDVKASHRRVVLGRPQRGAFQERIRRIGEQSSRIREFCPTIVPGLLQSADYMRAVFSPHAGSEHEMARAVSARLQGQSVLDDPGKTVEIITTEGALGWPAGPPELMAAQCERIADRIAHGARVGIIPFGGTGTQAVAFPVSAWTLYDDRVVIPGMLGVQAVLEPPDVAAYVQQWELVEPLAVFGDDAHETFLRIANHYLGGT